MGPDAAWLIVDGDNVAHALRSGGQSPSEARLDLLRRLRERGHLYKIAVVFDGYPETRGTGTVQRQGGIEVQYSCERKADELVCGLAGKLGMGARVISDDRAVRDSALRAGCLVSGAESIVPRFGAGGRDARPEADDEAGRDVKRGQAHRARRRRGSPEWHL